MDGWLLYLEPEVGPCVPEVGVCGGRSCLPHADRKWESKERIKIRHNVQRPTSSNEEEVSRTP